MSAVLVEAWRLRAAAAAEQASAMRPGDLTPEESVRLATLLALANTWTMAADEIEEGRFTAAEQSAVVLPRAVLSALYRLGVAAYELENCPNYFAAASQYAARLREMRIEVRRALGRK